MKQNITFSSLVTHTGHISRDQMPLVLSGNDTEQCRYWTFLFFAKVSVGHGWSRLYPFQHDKECFLKP